MRIQAFICIFFSILLSCNQQNTQTLDGPTSGHIAIAVDESYQPVFDSMVHVYEALNSKAEIDDKYVPEGKAIDLLLADSVRLAIVPRKLTEAEESVFKQQNLKPRYTSIGHDAVAVILHPSNTDSILTMEKLKQIFSGKTKKWSELNPKSKIQKPIKIVMDHSKSSVVRTVVDKVLMNEQLSADAFATGNNPSVIEYVSNNPEAIGVIALPWISDPEDSTANHFLSKIQVAYIQTETVEEPMRPYMFYLDKYPMARELFIISREARSGLGTGFASFVAGEKGQRLIYKADILPAQGIQRLTEWKVKNLN